MSGRFCRTVSRLYKKPVYFARLYKKPVYFADPYIFLRIRKERKRKSHLCRGESCVEGDDGENVDEEDDHAGDGNRAGKVPHGVLGTSLMKTFRIFAITFISSMMKLR